MRRATLVVKALVYLLAIGSVSSLWAQTIPEHAKDNVPQKQTGWFATGHTHPKSEEDKTIDKKSEDYQNGDVFAVWYYGFVAGSAGVTITIRYETLLREEDKQKDGKTERGKLRRGPEFLLVINSFGGRTQFGYLDKKEQFRPYEVTDMEAVRNFKNRSIGELIDKKDMPDSAEEALILFPVLIEKIGYKFEIPTKAPRKPDERKE